MKRLFLLAALACGYVCAQTPAPVGIGSLPVATSPLTTAEAIPCEQSGTKQCSVAQINAAVNASNITAGVHYVD